MALLTKKRNPLLSDAGVQILNYRIEQEELSARLYLSMSMWLNDNGYVGAAKKWKQYSDEEMAHSNWAKEYLLAMGVQPSTPALAQMKQCKEMAASAQKEGDYLLYQFAFKYLSEQVEEHQKMQDLVDRLEAFGTDKIALRLLDEELGK